MFPYSSIILGFVKGIALSNIRHLNNIPSISTTDFFSWDKCDVMSLSKKIKIGYDKQKIRWIRQKLCNLFQSYFANKQT